MQNKRQNPLKVFAAASIAILLTPVIVLAMLPTIIFGTLFGNGTNSPNGFSDGPTLSNNIIELNTGISTVLSEGLQDALDRIDADFAASGKDEYTIDNPYGSDIRFNAGSFLSMYCAQKDQEPEKITKDDMLSILRANKDKLYSYTYSDTTREDEGEADPDTGKATTVTVYIRNYVVSYNGEAYFADRVFGLTPDQKTLAQNYAQNLATVSRDGNLQLLLASDYTDSGINYDGITFTDGSVQVVYFNQMDERWKDAPYGTDNVGYYGCGPTAMSIVVSSLTSSTVDPPHMAQWAYENGYWCSESGSYQSIVKGAAAAWGLPVELCGRTDAQKLADALGAGKLVVAIMGPGHFTRSGHFIVLRGITASGKVLVADPASYRRSEQEWDISTIVSEASLNAVSDCPFWIIQ